MRAVVLGYGRSGKAAEALLRRRGFSVVVLEGEAEFPEGEFECAIVSPGISQTHRWVLEAKRRGITLKSELQLGCEELRRRGTKLLAVTGSKGKSSVVKLVAEALGGVACGNYGLPVCEVGECEWAVVEVSSFMMETTLLKGDTFEAAAVLNLQEDHLDRHGSVEVYHALKRRLLDFTKEKIIGVKAEDGRLWAGSYFDNEVLGGNAAAAVRLMKSAGLGEEAIAGAFRRFLPLPHRMAEVAEIGGVKYIDDSKATSIAALEAGVRMCKGAVRLIAGGLGKGDDPREALAILTERVKKVYLIGQSADAFSKAWSVAVDCEICGDLARAVESARRDAVSGETVLLSPGTASFDQFSSFGERGDVFACLVKKGKKE